MTMTIYDKRYVFWCFAFLFYVLLTVHLSVILAINQLNAQIIILK